jgi:cytochrome c-type biogenesis protein CcmF
MMTVAGRSVRLRNVWQREEPQRWVIGATLDVMSDSQTVIGALEPRMNYYPSSGQPVPTPDVRSGIRGDLYATLMSYDTLGRHATVKLIVEPLVPWIWFGGLIVVAGAVIAATQKLRTTARTVEAGA